MPELPWTVLVLNSGPFPSQLLHEGLVLTGHLSHTWKFQLQVGQGRIAMSPRLACVVVPQKGGRSASSCSRAITSSVDPKAKQGQVAPLNQPFLSPSVGPGRTLLKLKGVRILQTPHWESCPRSLKPQETVAGADGAQPDKEFTSVHTRRVG